MMDVQHWHETENDGLIRLRLPRDILVILTPHEFARALKRGKLERRAADRATRAQHMSARDEAQRLDWLGDE